MIMDSVQPALPTHRRASMVWNASQATGQCCTRSSWMCACDTRSISSCTPVMMSLESWHPARVDLKAASASIMFRAVATAGACPMMCAHAASTKTREP